MNWESRLDGRTRFLIVWVYVYVHPVNSIDDDEELEAELEALGDELAMEEELKEEEGAMPRYTSD
jgi:hypothetical protein